MEDQCSVTLPSGHVDLSLPRFELGRYPCLEIRTQALLWRFLIRFEPFSLYSVVNDLFSFAWLAIPRNHLSCFLLCPPRFSWKTSSWIGSFHRAKCRSQERNCSLGGTLWAWASSSDPAYFYAQSLRCRATKKLADTVEFCRAGPEWLPGQTSKCRTLPCTGSDSATWARVCRWSTREDWAGGRGHTFAP